MFRKSSTELVVEGHTAVPLCGSTSVVGPDVSVSDAIRAISH